MDAIADHIWQSTICTAVAAAIEWPFRNNTASLRSVLLSEFPLLPAVSESVLVEGLTSQDATVPFLGGRTVKPTLSGIQMTVGSDRFAAS